MTPEQLAAIAHRIETPSTGYHVAYRDRIMLLAYVHQLRAVVAAADALYDAWNDPGDDAVEKGKAYRAARKQLEGM